MPVCSDQPRSAVRAIWRRSTGAGRRRKAFGRRRSRRTRGAHSPASRAGRVVAMSPRAVVPERGPMRGRPVPAIDGPEPAPVRPACAVERAGRYLPFGDAVQVGELRDQGVRPARRGARAGRRWRRPRRRSRGSGFQRIAQDAHRLVEYVLLDGQREQEAHHVGIDAAGQQDELALERPACTFFVKSASASPLPGLLNCAATIAPGPRTSAIWAAPPCACRRARP